MTAIHSAQSICCLSCPVFISKKLFYTKNLIFNILIKIGGESPRMNVENSKKNFRINGKRKDSTVSLITRPRIIPEPYQNFRHLPVNSH